jgi:FkbM family methyltransferase
MQKNVSKSDYIRSSLKLPATQLRDVTSMIRNRELASRLERDSEIELGNLKITKLDGKNGGGFIRFSYKGRQLKFFYDSRGKLAEALGMVSDEFINGESNRIDVKKRDVVDIGAYVADTAICYISNGARHVYAFEPYPYFYKIANINIKANGLAKKITMVNAGCGGESSTISINKYSKNFAKLKDRKVEKRASKEIDVVSLKQIVETYKLKDAVLKVDCEGCEYDIILKTGESILRRFSEIQIEYHYGYGNLKEKLKGIGFRMKHTKPFKKYNFATNSFMTVGFINAKRQ